MIVAFCGHSYFSKTEEYEQKIFHLLERNVGDNPAQLYLGGYGDFDAFAYNCGKKYKETHPNVSLVFVTPYLTVGYQRNCLEHQKARYDSILYPDIENVPPRFAISHRNKYMIEKADFVIAYVDHDWGGAYKTYKHAKRKGKVVFNLAEKEID